MNTIINKIIDLSNSTENVQKKVDSIGNKNVSKTDNPSLFQGYKFKQYQTRIKKDLEANNKEGFLNIDAGKLTSESKNVLKETTNDIKSQENIIENLKQQYNSTLNQYKQLLSTFSENSTSYINRTSNTNPYLNKIIKFKTGQLCYVTNLGVAKYIPSTEILKSISGKNGCPNTSSNYVDINLPWKNDYNSEGVVIPTTPPLLTGSNMRLNESCGYEGSNIFVNTMLSNSNPNPNYIGCYQDNTANPAMTFLGGSPPSSTSSANNTSGNYNFNQCKQEAILGGYQYFALQNVNSSTGLGYCAVSNNQTNSSQYGTAYASVPLWSSNTSNSSATHAIITNNGTLNVLDQNGAVLFTTPNGTNCTQVYSTTANTDAPGNDLSYVSNQTVNSCKTLCNNNSNCKGFAFNTSTNNSCWLKSGNLTNTSANKSRTLYKKTVDTSQCNYFLSLQSDGNMSIYKGEPNTRNTTNIWSTNTSSKQQEGNGAYVSSKGKYGMSFLKTNQVLNKGDWVGSTDGKLLLIMQNDGNLVLYTFKINCSMGSATSTLNNNYGGGVLANALYDIGNVGNKNNMSQVAYLDSDSKLYPYPSSNTKLSNTYSLVLQNTNVQGNNIQGSATSNVSNVNDCMNTCNSNSNCNSFVYDTTGPTPVCLPKKISNAYSTSNFSPKTGIQTYIRDKTVITPPVGVSNNINNIDSIRYENYTKGGNLQKSYGLSSLNSVQQQQLSQLQDKLNQLSRQILNSTNKLSKNNNSVNHQTREDIKGFNNYISDINLTNTKISDINSNNNIDNILKDTNIRILQQNYKYMLFSILAAGAVIIAINIKKTNNQ
jgi:hypothetical protein